MNAIGLDIGTTSISATVIDISTGKTLKTATAAGAADLAGEAWESVQHPDMLAGVALDMVSQLTQGYAPIASIGLTGQMHGILYIDKDGDALSPLYTWQDKRADQLIPGADETHAGRMARLTGYKMATGYGAATHYWHVLNGCVPEGAACFLNIHDYVGMKLTGRQAPLMHLTDAAGIGLFDLRARAFDAAAIKKCGLDLSFFPAVTSGEATLGTTPSGVPVSVAIGDNQAGYLGAVRDINESVMVSVGTSGQVTLTAGAGDVPPTIDVRPLSGASAIYVGATLSGGSAYAQLKAFFDSVLAMAGVAGAPDLYPAMNALGAEALSYPDALTVDTRFLGTRLDPGVRGAITGIGKANFTAAHLTAGVLSGIAGELNALYRQMLDAGAHPRTSLIGAGNALRRNPALAKAFESAFAMPLKMPAHREEAAYGAALFGLAAAGVMSLKDAQALIAYE